jgi:hypothetical protein
MAVPNELALHLGNLDMLVIQLPDNARIPVVVKLCEFLGQVDRFHNKRGLILDVARLKGDSLSRELHTNDPFL